MLASVSLVVLLAISSASCTGPPRLVGDRAELVALDEGAHLGLLTGRYEDALPDEAPALIAALYFVHPPAGISSIEHDVRTGPHPGLRIVWSPARGARAGLPHEVRAEVSPRSGGLRIREKEYRLDEGRVFVIEGHDDGTITSRQVDASPPADVDAILDALQR